MRELKFRAWDNIKKEWLLGYEYKNLGGFSLFGEMMAMGEWEQILSKMIHGDYGNTGNELKVMQYTGLKDKNGKEIYEGDILEYCIQGNKQANPMIVKIPDIFIELGHDDQYYLPQEKSFEIIGNIYENKELLK